MYVAGASDVSDVNNETDAMADDADWSMHAADGPDGTGGTNSTC